MKVALCICGLTDNYQGSIDVLKQRLLDSSNVDIYIHAWETRVAIIEDIKEKYKPVKYIFEPQKFFNEELSRYDVARLEHSGTSLFKLLSYTYSRERCFSLVDSYYDCVILCRFDVYNWHGMPNLPQDELCMLRFDKNADMQFIYSKLWNQLNAGFAEQWFYSSYENMQTVCSLYKSIPEYLRDGSDYFKKLFIEGWPESSRLDEFSNEILKPQSERSNHQLLLTTNAAVLNHHYMYKYHLYVNNLLEKCKFL